MRCQMKTIFIATPAFAGQVTTPYLTSVLALWEIAYKADIALSWNSVADPMITRARPALLSKFVREGADYILFIDADMGFGPEQVLAMLDFGKDFVAGSGPKKAYPIKMVGELCSQGPPKTRFEQAIRVGAAFMLLTRAAVLKLIEAYPKLKYHGDMVINSPIHCNAWGSRTPDGWKLRRYGCQRRGLGAWLRASPAHFSPFAGSRGAHMHGAPPLRRHPSVSGAPPRAGSLYGPARPDHRRYRRPSAAAEHPETVPRDAPHNFNGRAPCRPLGVPGSRPGGGGYGMISSLNFWPLPPKQQCAPSNPRRQQQVSRPGQPAPQHPP
jgi:hypothetical protein